MTKWLQTKLALVCAVCLLCAMTSGYAAVDQDPAGEHTAYDKMYVYVDGELEYTGYEINGITYLPLRSFCRSLDMGATVSWDSTTGRFSAMLHEEVITETLVQPEPMEEELPPPEPTPEVLPELTAPGEEAEVAVDEPVETPAPIVTPEPTPTVVQTVSYRPHSISAGAGDEYLLVDERAIYLGVPIVNHGGNILVPLDGLCRGFNLGAAYDEQLGGLNLDTAALQVIAPGSSVYNETDLHWLARIIHAEAGNQSMEGRICVGNVVLNRVKSDRFPDTIKDVILSPGQFCPVTSGNVYCTPSPESIAAAKLCLEGVNLAGESTYFVNPVTGVTGWFRSNLTYVMTVGEHDFYC